MKSMKLEEKSSQKIDFPGEKEASWWTIYAFLIFFKIHGLATFSIKRVKFCKNLEPTPSIPIFFVRSLGGVAYNVILTILSTTIGMFSVLDKTFVNFAGNSPFLESVDAVHTILAIIVLFATFTNCCFNEKSMIGIAEKSVKIIHDFRVSDFSLKHARLYRSFFLTIILNFTFCFLHIALFFPVHEKYIRDLHWFVMMLATYCVNIFFIQYATLILFLLARLLEINEALKKFSIVDVHDVPFSYPLSPEILSIDANVNRLWFVRSAYSSVSLLSNEIHEFFSLPVLLCVLYVLYGFTNSAAYVIILVQSSVKLVFMNTSALVLYMVSISFSLVVLTFAITELTNKVAETARAVHGLLNYTTDREFKSELKLFSLQLLHEKPVFTACGFFTLDCTLLQAIVGAVATYMVILIQFQVSSTQQKPSCCSSNCTKS